jgi:hypothetical protein
MASLRKIQRAGATAERTAGRGRSIGAKAAIKITNKAQGEDVAAYLGDKKTTPKTSKKIAKAASASTKGVIKQYKKTTDLDAKRSGPKSGFLAKAKKR